VQPVGAQDDGVVGEQNEDQEHVAEPARPPLTVAHVREMTAGLHEAMDDVRRSVAVLAARVRDAVTRIFSSHNDVVSPAPGLLCLIVASCVALVELADDLS